MIRLALYSFTGMMASSAGFVLGLYFTFPSDAAITYLTYEVDRASNHEFGISADSLHPWWGLGVSFDNLTVYNVKRGKRVKDQPQVYDRTPLVQFDALGVRLSPFSFLTGKQGYAFSADMLGGDLSGLYAFSADLVDLTFDIDSLDLSQIGSGSTENILNLVGGLGGEADLHIDLKEIKQSTGTVALSIKEFGIAAGSKMSGFELPETKFSTARLGFEVREGKMTVTEGTFEGDIITATLSGDVTMNKRFGRSRNKLDLAFTLPEDMQKLADAVSPTLKRSKDDEGRYHCSVQGTISAPSFRCGKGITPKTTTRDGGIGPMSDGPIIGEGPGAGGNSELSDEERRAKREERIRDRRERLRKRREEQGLTPMSTPERPNLPFDPGEDGPMIDDPPGLDQRFQDPEDLPEDVFPPDPMPEPIYEDE